ncbi:hypothetical protein JOB18_040325 [Solea senegalensis]|uniref:Uncharacterized protein n=1 Tax=Solea senegalensis TaxID=28829 RepID=A0AAV6R4T0_SOLSE|nr:hypothetical protein JOB18_040325 [Solea senegalensis]
MSNAQHPRQSAWDTVCTGWPYKGGTTTSGEQAALLTRASECKVDGWVTNKTPLSATAPCHLSVRKRRRGGVCLNCYRPSSCKHAGFHANREQDPHSSPAGGRQEEEEERKYMGSLGGLLCLRVHIKTLSRLSGLQQPLIVTHVTCGKVFATATIIDCTVECFSTGSKYQGCSRSSKDFSHEWK